MGATLWASGAIGIAVVTAGCNKGPDASGIAANSSQCNRAGWHECLNEPLTSAARARGAVDRLTLS